MVVRPGSIIGTLTIAVPARVIVITESKLSSRASVEAAPSTTTSKITAIICLRSHLVPLQSLESRILCEERGRKCKTCGLAIYAGHDDWLRWLHRTRKLLSHESTLAFESLFIQ